MTGAQVALRDQMDYANALAGSNLLPAQYRKQPANVLWAIEYGQAIGLTPMAAITGVHVIDGKPSASAGLISGLVRRAGHKLRITGDATSATVTIIRSDDPDHPFEVTFTIDDARTAGLLSKDVWKKYPTSMLKARAITQCARDACEEVLFGLHYTPEELGAETDEDGIPSQERVPVVVTTVVEPSAAADVEDRESDAIAVAQAGAKDGDPEVIRARWRDATHQGLIEVDVSQGGYTEAERQTAGVPDGPCTLGQWLAACGTWTRDNGGLSVADAASFDTDTPDADTTVEVQGELVEVAS